VLIAVGAALVMTVLPARRAAQLTPAEALREG
jgi:ABC-type lipoprotein release transport system permease subunit